MARMRKGDSIIRETTSVRAVLLPPGRDGIPPAADDHLEVKYRDFLLSLSLLISFLTSCVSLSLFCSLLTPRLFLCAEPTPHLTHTPFPTQPPTSNSLLSRTSPSPLPHATVFVQSLSVQSSDPANPPSPPKRHRPARPADPRSRVAAPGLPPLREPHALPVSRRHLQGRVPRPSPTPIAVDPQSLLAIATTFPPSTPRVGPSEPCEQVFLRSAPVIPCAHVHDGYNSAALPFFWPAGGPRYRHPAKRSDRNRAPALGALCQTPRGPRLSPGCAEA